MSEPGREHAVVSPRDPRASLAALARAAEDWGGTWRPADDGGGQLELPVLAGLRRGWVIGRITAEREGAGTRVRLRVEESVYRLHWPSVLFLLLGACAGLGVVVAPFVPTLLPLLPVGVVLSLAAWLLIVATLRNSGVEEFLSSLAEEA